MMGRDGAERDGMGRYPFMPFLSDGMGWDGSDRVDFVLVSFCVGWMVLILVLVLSKETKQASPGGTRDSTLLRCDSSTR
jgi:hypothetical protein